MLSNSHKKGIQAFLCRTMVLSDYRPDRHHLNTTGVRVVCVVGSYSLFTQRKRAIGTTKTAIAIIDATASYFTEAHQRQRSFHRRFWPLLAMESNWFQVSGQLSCYHDESRQLSCYHDEISTLTEAKLAGKITMFQHSIDMIRFRDMCLIWFGTLRVSR